MPIYMIVFFAVGNLVMYFYNVKYGMVTSGLIALYFLLVFEGYRYCSAKITEEILEFAAHYGMVQKKLLDELLIPYALMDEGGKIIWMNK